MDLYTPGMCGMHECVEGLPKDVTLMHIYFDKKTNTVTYFFDDEKVEVNTITLTYVSGMEK